MARPEEGHITVLKLGCHNFCSVARHIVLHESVGLTRLATVTQIIAKKFQIIILVHKHVWAAPQVSRHHGIKCIPTSLRHLGILVGPHHIMFKTQVVMHTMLHCPDRHFTQQIRVIFKCHKYWHTYQNHAS